MQQCSVLLPVTDSFPAFLYFLSFFVQSIMLTVCRKHKSLSCLSSCYKLLLLLVSYVLGSHSLYCTVFQCQHASN